MFETVLVANRGEIAVRIISTLRRLGIQSVAVYSDADVDSRHVREADMAVRIGPAPASESYLSSERILEAAVRSHAQAIHPGYGFLSENASFVRSCEAAGVIFVGPSADVVEMMGDKIRAKLTVAAAGVPVVPGRTAAELSDSDLTTAAKEIGFPVLIKPSAGGGGKGMRLVTSLGELADALTSARREAAASFGDDTLFLERFVATPRHIEVQILSDTYGNTVHLGERECSLQRRHQKVIEEAPSTLLDDATRESITASAVTTAWSVGYRGVGTVEFIVSADAPDEFFFMEMNTRLQVEHPVTEMITGLDLVEQQLRVAADEALAFTQQEIRFTGHSIEARVYAENPAQGFLPTGGRVLMLREPTGEGVRIDSSLIEQVQIGSHYDPMLAKVISYGPDRFIARARLDRALAETVILGVGTNIAFLRALLSNAHVRSGELDTGLIERELDSLVASGFVDSTLPMEVCAAFALHRLATLEPTSAIFARWDVSDGWRVGNRVPIRCSLVTADESQLKVSVTGTPRMAHLSVERVDVHGDVTSSDVTCALIGGWESGELLVSVNDKVARAFVVSDQDETWIWMNGQTRVLCVQSHVASGGGSRGGDGEIRSPMPGTVIEVGVERDDSVTRGRRLIVIEAMKMENALTAPFDGSVTDVLVAVGDQVVVNQILMHVTPTNETTSMKSMGGS